MMLCSKKDCKLEPKYRVIIKTIDSEGKGISLHISMMLCEAHKLITAKDIIDDNAWETLAALHKANLASSPIRPYTSIELEPIGTIKYSERVN